MLDRVHHGVRRVLRAELRGLTLGCGDARVAPVRDDAVLVLGVGAIGGTTGGGMLLAGRAATLVDTWFENVETIRRRGLTVTLDGTPARDARDDPLPATSSRRRRRSSSLPASPTTPTRRCG